VPVQLGVAHAADPAADRPSSQGRTHAEPGSAIKGNRIMPTAKPAEVADQHE